VRRLKLIIKEKYFDAIKNGIKDFDYRDGHITFICLEKPEKQMCKEVIGVALINRDSSLCPEHDCLHDKEIIRFHLGDDYNGPDKKT